ARGAGAPVRLLPIGAAHVGGLPARDEPHAERRGHRRRHVGQPLPLRDVPPHPPRHPSRGRARPRSVEVTAAAAVCRRVFLQAAAAAGGGLVLTGVARSEDGSAAARPTAAGARDVPLNAWLRITTDDQVTLICSQSEMGQGIMTTLPAVLAEELGADWKRVKVEISPLAAVYRNPRINWMFTGNSESTSAFFDLLLQMGASAREMLIAAAAKRWGAPPRECRAEGGRVLHAPSGRALTFGDLADAAARETPPEKPPLKSQKDWTLLGRSLPRVELPSKLDGSAVFGLDFRVPGMLYAAVKQSPVFGGQVKSFDKEAALRRPGVVDVVPIPNGVA